MARTAKTTNTEPAVEEVIAEESAPTPSVSAEENANEEVVEEKKTTTRTRKTKATKIAEEEPLEDSDEIEVMALIPNVSYEDSRTSDYYRWESVGQVELMTFDAIKAMHRKYKSYFGDMWLKPLDERVIKKLGLARTYEKYDYLMDEKNYTKDKIDEVLEGFSSASNGLKMAVVNRVKDLVAQGVVTNVQVIRKIEKKLDIELFSFLG